MAPYVMRDRYLNPHPGFKVPCGPQQLPAIHACYSASHECRQPGATAWGNEQQTEETVLHSCKKNSSILGHSLRRDTVDLTIRSLPNDQLIVSVL